MALRNLDYLINFRTNNRGLDKTNKSTSKIEKGLNNADKAGRDFNNTMRDSSSSVASVAKAIATGFVVNKIYDFGKAAITTFADFEQAMANVHSIMPQISDVDFKKMEDAAKQAGATTKFSATEAANALWYLSSAGYDASQSAELMPKVLKFAAAGNIEVAAAADLVTGSMGAMGIATKDVGTFMDALVKGGEISKSSVDELGLGFKEVGGVAKSAGMSFQNVITELGILSDAGKEGAEGGTGLRNILLNLTAPTNEVAELMKDLGIKTTDANGKFKPFNDILKDLNKSLGGYTQAQQQGIKETIGGKENIQSLNILLAASGKKYDEYSSKIEKSTGAAEKSADIMANTTAGAFEELKSSIEGAMIDISKDTGFAKGIRNITEYITQNMPAIKEKATTVVKGLGDALIFVGDGFKWLLDHKEAVEAAIISIGTAFVTAKGIIIGAGLVKTVKNIFTIITLTAGGAGTLIESIAATTGAASAVAFQVGLVAGVVAVFALIVYECVKHWDGIKAATSTLVDNIGIFFSNMGTHIVNGFKDIANGFIEDVINPIESAINHIPGIEIPITTKYEMGTTKDYKSIGGAYSKAEAEAAFLAEKAKQAPTPKKIPAKANGGDVKKGQIFQVNENGGEIQKAASDRTIIPHDISMEMARSSGKGNIAFNPTINITVNGSTNNETIDNMRRAMRNEIENFFGDKIAQLI